MLHGHFAVKHEEKSADEGDFPHLLPLKAGGEGNIPQLQFSLH